MPAVGRLWPSVDDDDVGVDEDDVKRPVKGRDHHVTAFTSGKTIVLPLDADNNILVRTMIMINIQKMMKMLMILESRSSIFLNHGWRFLWDQNRFLKMGIVYLGSGLPATAVQVRPTEVPATPRTTCCSFALQRFAKFFSQLEI